MIDHLGNLLPDLNLDGPFAVNFFQNFAVLGIELQFSLVVADIFFCLRHAQFHAPDQLALGACNQLRLGDLILDLAQQFQGLVRVFIPEPGRFRLSSTDIGRKLSCQHRLPDVRVIDQ